MIELGSVVKFTVSCKKNGEPKIRTGTVVSKMGDAIRVRFREGTKMKHWEGLVRTVQPVVVEDKSETKKMSGVQK